MTEIQTLVIEAIKTMQNEQEALKEQFLILEARLTKLEQTQNALLTTQEELGKTQNILLSAQEEVSSLCKGLEVSLITQSVKAKILLKEFEELVANLRKEE